MFEAMEIQSHKGTYAVHFGSDQLQAFVSQPPEGRQVIIDSKVADLHQNALGKLIQDPRVLRIDVCEEAKTLERLPNYVEHLVKNGVRRNDKLIAIGGGVIQDITCFLAATMMRGMDWLFVPTTLLAQADSCIGSKSSINASCAKNILGTFNPPKAIYLALDFLDTLTHEELLSGVGEMLKVHAIAGPDAFEAIKADYRKLFSEPTTMAAYIYQSLQIKKGFIEIDEFDRGPRNIFNYGHSFGHAIESATDYAIPHGIAVTIGMDMANFVAMNLGVTSRQVYERMHPILAENYNQTNSIAVDVDRMMLALSKDKKNVGKDSVTLILPDIDGKIKLGVYPLDDTLREHCQQLLASRRPS